MHIHTKRSDESIADIAEGYGIWEDNLRLTNGLGDSEGAEGEELLILVPTRSYTVQSGDRTDRISLRFGIRRSDIYAQNPWLCGRELREGERISIKCGERCGMAVANGYFYKGCSKEALISAMPHLTYVTFCSAIADRRGISRSFKDGEAVELTRLHGRIPLIRVYDRYTERYSSCDKEGFARELIDLALSGGYKGIVLDACPLLNSAEEFVEFLMTLRKLMIGCDLILITEINENSPLDFSEYADGCVLYYPKLARGDEDFCKGERRVIEDFACRGESAKAFIDLPSLARMGERYIPEDKAREIARAGGCRITQNKSTLLSRFYDRKQGECVYTSLYGIRALLELVREFGYMGVCFDIMRSPLSHIMMYGAMFKSSYSAY